MRRVLSLVLLGVSGFVLTTALLAMVYVPGQVKKTPLNIDTKTYLSGQAAVLPDGSSSAINAFDHTRADGKVSDGSVIVFDELTCVVKSLDGGAVPDCVNDQDPQTRLVTASTDRFAEDRVSAIAVNTEKYVGADATLHDGLVNKFPFGAQKKTYPFWDGTLGKALDAVYQGEEAINGLNTYKFGISVADQAAQIAEGVQGTYSDDKTMWIDPVTGSIIKSSEHQVRKLDSGDTALDLTLAYTDGTVAKNVSDAKSNGGQLSLIGNLPWIAGLIGLLALAGGLLLMRGTSAASSGRDDSGLDALIDAKARRG